MVTPIVIASIVFLIVIMCVVTLGEGMDKSKAETQQWILIVIFAMEGVLLLSFYRDAKDKVLTKDMFEKTDIKLNDSDLYKLK